MRTKDLPKKPLAPRTAQKRVAGQGINARLFYGLFAVLFSTNVLTAFALLISPDIAALLNHEQTRIVSGYEDKLAQLRLEVDRLHSRQYAQAGNMNLQLQELSQQQEELAEQHQYVKALIDRADSLGLGVASTVKPNAGPAPAPLPDDAVTTPASLEINGATAKPGGMAEASENQILSTGRALRRMMDESRMALSSISSSADTATTRIVGALNGIGIKPKLPADAASDDEGVGGPLLPPLAGAPDANSDESDIVDQANAVATALARFQAARDTLAEAPIQKPVASTLISSGFGNRRDPFTGRMALHAGIDFPDVRGTIVHSAADGKVIYAGPASGYGNLVEIDHGNGYTTRYGHLSAFIVHQGDIVKAGDPIAKVGSTGRSTGPHLHFEVRRNGSPLNPAGFLAIGRQLAQFIPVG